MVIAAIESSGVNASRLPTTTVFSALNPLFYELKVLSDMQYKELYVRCLGGMNTRKVLARMSSADHHCLFFQLIVMQYLRNVTIS